MFIRLWKILKRGVDPVGHGLRPQAAEAVIDWLGK